MTAREALELWEAYGDCVSLPQLYRPLSRPIGDVKQAIPCPTARCRRHRIRQCGQ